MTASRCLTCHAPIAERIARRRGVHRDVKDDCVTCHVEHAGRDAELRPLEKATFDHAIETGFPLDGRHAPLAKRLRPMPQDAIVHCGQTRVLELSHRRAQGDAGGRLHHVPLRGGAVQAGIPLVRPREGRVPADRRPPARGVREVPRQPARSRGFASPAAPTATGSPTSRRSVSTAPPATRPTTWQTQKVDHARTAFPLVGKHVAVACAKCHVQAPMRAKPKFARCSDCHSDPHRGQFKEGCESCHKETGFKGASSFDHEKRTGFALTGRHAALECSKCHQGPPAAARTSGSPSAPRAIDFRGLKRECATCHTDVHKGELGATCVSCHSTQTFKITTFTHPRFTEFFEGSHAGVACSKCHVTSAPSAPMRTGAPVPGLKFRDLSTACASCHADPHLGQVSRQCESCHDVKGAKFVTTGFSHDRVVSFTLVGKHAEVACGKCHKVETGTFPAGQGTARRLRGVPVDCASCHKDPHLGQVSRQCETCHTPSGFAVTTFTHKGLDAFFVGRHRGLECIQCHRKLDAEFPAGRGTAVKFKVGTECSSCHRDAHAGALGQACASCHTPELWQNPNKAFHKVTVFPLEGRHLAVPCQSCHLHGQLKGTPMRCYDCHWIRRQDDKLPDASRQRLRELPSSDLVDRGELGSRRAHGHAAQRVAPDARVRLVSQEPSICRHQARVHLVPREGLPRRADPESRSRGLPARLRRVPHAVGADLPRRALYARHLFAGGTTCDAGVRVVPSQQRLPWHAARLCRLPPDGLPTHHVTRSRVGRLFHRVRVVPSLHRQLMARRELQSLAILRAAGCARDAGVRVVPQERPIQGYGARLRHVSPGGLSAGAEPEPRRGRVPHRVRVVPSGHRRELGRRDLQPRVGVSAAGCTRDGGLRVVPQEQHLQGHVA